MALNKQLIGHVKGDPGPKGDPGEKGKPFTYDDFTEEQLAALKGDISGDYTALSSSGLNPTLVNSTNAPIISFKGDGATEQQTYSGKNLVYKIDGRALNPDGALTTNEAYRTIYANLPNAGNYCLNISADEDIYITRYNLNNQNKEIGLTVNTLLITATEPSELALTFRNTDTTNAFTNLQVQIELGDTATPYEPYVGGIASPNPSYPQEIYGVGESRNEFNKENVTSGYYLTSDGTETKGDSWNISEYISCYPNTSYTLSGGTEKGNATSVCWYDADKNYIGGKGYSNASTVTITTSSDARYIRASCDKTTLDTFQIEKGDKATPYKAFGAHSLSVKSIGKNIINASFETGTKSGITCTDNGDGTYSVIGTNNSSSYVSFNANLSHNAKGKGKLVGCPKTENAILQTCYNGSWASSNNTWDRGDGSVINNMELLTKLAILVSAGKTVNLTFKPMLTTDLSATYDDYEPYTETTANIPLSSPLYEGDYIRYNMDGSGELVRKMQSVVFDGSESGWYFEQGTDTDYFHKKLSPSAKGRSVNVYSSHFKNDGTTGRTENNIYTNSDGRLLIRTNKLTSLAEWKAWLAENPITVVYELAEPEVTPLTAEQIAEFEKLRSFDGVTHVTCEAEVKMSYFCDSESGKAVVMAMGKGGAGSNELDAVASQANTNFPIIKESLQMMTNALYLIDQTTGAKYKLVVDAGQLHLEENTDESVYYLVNNIIGKSDYDPSLREDELLFRTQDELICTIYSSLYNETREYRKYNSGNAIGGYATIDAGATFTGAFLIAENPEDCATNISFEPSINFVYEKDGKTYYVNVGSAFDGVQNSTDGRGLYLNDISEIAIKLQGQTPSIEQLATLTLDYFYGYI